MGITSLFNRFRKLAHELRTANGANVTITFALVTIPMVGFVGAAVDYSRANSVKSAMQAASDATALMLSKVASGMTATDIQTKGTAYFQALFTRPNVTGLQVTSTYTTTNGSQSAASARPVITSAGGSDAPTTAWSFATAAGFRAGAAIS